MVCDFVTVPELPTITKLRVMSRGQQLIRLDFEDSFSQVDSQPMLDRLTTYLPQVSALILSDYGKGALDDVQTMIQQAKAAKVPVLLTLKERILNVTVAQPY